MHTFQTLRVALSALQVESTPFQFAQKRLLKEICLQYIASKPESQECTQWKPLNLLIQVSFDMSVSAWFCLYVSQQSLWCIQALETFSVADNHLRSLHSGLSSLTSLKQFWMYGNHLQTLPADILDMPAIQSTLCLVCCSLMAPLACCGFACLPVGYLCCLHLWDQQSPCRSAATCSVATIQFEASCHVKTM